MNEKTGEIGSFEELTRKGAKPEDLRRLTDEEHRQLKPMNRHERRKWAAEQRRAERKAERKLAD